MALEKSCLDEVSIKEILKHQYGIEKIISVSSINEGSSNIYKVETTEGTYILKEYNSDRNLESIEKEISVVQHLKNKRLSVPNFMQREDGGYISIFQGKIITLQDFIDGYTIENNTGGKKRVIQSARLLGRIVEALKDYKGLSENGCMEKMFSKSALQRATSVVRNEYEGIRIDNSYRELFIKDLGDKLKMCNFLLENFNFDVLNHLTILGTHGDYSVRQLIYGNSNEEDVTVIDFETARRMPITWEIMRSYSYIDEKAKNSKFDMENLVDYYREFNKQVELNEYDLKYAPYIYLLQLVGSAFGYREYNKDKTQEDLLRFGQFRTNLCRYLFVNANNIGEQLLSRVRNKEKEVER